MSIYAQFLLQHRVSEALYISMYALVDIEGKVNYYYVSRRNQNIQHKLLLYTNKMISAVYYNTIYGYMNKTWTVIINEVEPKIRI